MCASTSEHDGFESRDLTTPLGALCCGECEAEMHNEWDDEAEEGDYYWWEEEEEAEEGECSGFYCAHCDSFLTNQTGPHGELGGGWDDQDN